MSGSDKTQNKATIFDVAELAGVSIKTVSRVVNSEPNVRAKTRDKVRKAIRKLSYQPNAAARGLSGKRSWAIGLVYENPNEFSYVGAFLDGALRACEDEGYSLLLRPLTLPDPDIVEDISRFARQARLDGMILPAPVGDFPEVLQSLRKMEIPFVTITPKAVTPDAINIECEDELASLELTGHLIGLGHRKIGFIKGHPDHGASAKRFAGYRRALKDHRIPYKASLVRQGHFDFDSGRRAAKKLLDLGDPPTVIVASNDDMAAGALFEARERGLLVPEDLSVAGFDDTPLASHIWPPLTTVRQPIRRMADSAARLLIRKIRGEDGEPPEQRFVCEVIIRGSSAAIR